MYAPCFNIAMPYSSPFFCIIFYTFQLVSFVWFVKCCSNDVVEHVTEKAFFRAIGINRKLNK